MWIRRQYSKWTTRSRESTRHLEGWGVWPLLQPQYACSFSYVCIPSWLAADCRCGHVLWHGNTFCTHYNDVIMGVTASQITSLAIVYSTVYLVSDQRKHQRSASLAFMWEFTGEFPAQRASNAENVSIWWRRHAFALCEGIHRSPVPYKMSSDAEFWLFL